jgi:hypothetical protein
MGQITYTAALIALGLPQVVLCFLSFASGVFILIGIYRLHGRLQRKHPEAFDESGLSPDWGGEDHPAEHLRNFKDFFSSGKHHALKDPHLGALWQNFESMKRLLLTSLLSCCCVLASHGNFARLGRPDTPQRS